jgi:hypothetical protein
MTSSANASGLFFIFSQFLTRKAFSAALTHPHNISDFEIGHTFHCIEYLRQAIRCAADPTLDPTTYHAERESHSSTGWNGTHVCRDYDALFAWAEDHRYNDAGEHDSHHG